MLIHMVKIFLFNTAIAFLMTYLEKGSFVSELILSQSIGFSIWLMSCTFFKPKMDGPPIQRLLQVLAMVILGSVLGIAVAGQISFYNFVHYFNQQHVVVAVFLISVMFGLGASYYFWFLYKEKSYQEELNAAKLIRLENEKLLSETELKLLQAQIEPHFLFNTLSNVLSLMDHDSKKARNLLHKFTLYLRQTLERTKNKPTTLADEIDLVKTYLEIQQVRMGERLRFTISVENSLNEINLPPYLLQPLVENSIVHGLEPKIDGGEVAIRAAISENVLSLTVSDTGLGLSKPNTFSSEHNGIALENIRRRLASFYGSGADLTMESGAGTGTVVKVKIPVTNKLTKV